MRTSKNVSESQSLNYALHPLQNVVYVRRPAPAYFLFQGLWPRRVSEYGLFHVEL